MRTFLALTFLLPFGLFAQKNITLQNTAELLQKGIELYDKEKYDEAIDIYKKIPINDTNYASAQYEMGLTYVALEQYPNAEEVLNDLLDYKINYAIKYQVYVMLGNAYDMDKKPEKAIEVYTEGIKLYPYQHNLLYNRAVCYELMKKYPEAVADYKAAIQGNMYHANSHFRLGYLTARMGLYDQAMLSLMTFLWLEPSDSRCGVIVSTLENMARGTMEDEKIPQVLYTGDVPYAEYNEFFEQKTALQPNYKIKLTVPTDYAKQFDLFLKNNHYEEGNLDFWNLTYMKFYDAIYKAKKYDLLVLLSLANVENEAVQAKVGSKIAKIKSFYEWSKVQYDLFSRTQYMEFEGKKQFVSVDYSRATFSSIGLYADPANKIPVGNHYSYYKNGTRELLAHYNDKGEPVGKWEIYNMYDGAKEREVEFVNATTKKNYEYYQSGQLQYQYVMKNDVVDDTVYVYYRNGQLEQKYVTKAGKKNGPYQSWYPNGALQSSRNYVNGLLEGEYKNYHPNGELEMECKLVADKVQGVQKFYYPNKQLEKEVNFVDDLYDGAYTEYYSNGQVMETSTYKKGNQVGESKEYYINGALSSTSTLDESGKQNGESVIYDLDGKKYMTFDFTKGVLNKITFTDKSGNSKELASIKSKKIDYIRNYPNGKLNVKGQFANDEKEGKWEYYDQYDNLWKVENYKSGKLVDTLVVYHSNGKVKRAYQIADGDYNGLYLEYNIFGDLIEEGIYTDGELDKDWYTYLPNGELDSHNGYSKGAKHGYRIDYTIAGTTSSVQQFDNGNLIFDLYMDTLGEVIQEFGEFNGEVKIKAANNQYYNSVGYFKNGNADGRMTYYYPNNKIESEGDYINDERTGTWKTYDVFGHLMREVPYVNGWEHGKETNYFDNGAVESVYNYVDGDMQGEFIVYYLNGKVAVRGTYLDGERHGKVTNYGEKGEVAMIRNYNRGVIESYSYLGTDGKEVTPIPMNGNEMKIVANYKNGKKSMEQHRVNGLLEGTYITFHENGQKSEESNFQFGEYHGKATEYSETGVKTIETDYEKGSKHGWEIIYYSNGKVKSKVPFVFGNRHGVATYYSADGKLVSTITYFNDETLEIK